LQKQWVLSEASRVKVLKVQGNQKLKKEGIQRRVVDRIREQANRNVDNREGAYRKRRKKRKKKLIIKGHERLKRKTPIS